MDSIEIAKFLATVRLFRKFEEQYLVKLAQLFEGRNLSKGQKLFSEGDPGGDFYIITSGKIHLARSAEDKEIEIGDLTMGEFFGEESYLSKKGHTATATAGAETHLLILKKEKLDLVIQENPEIKADFEALARSYQLARRKDFSWLIPGEIIHMVAKKHYFVLLKSLVLSAILGIIGSISLVIGFINSGGTIFGNLLFSVPGAIVTSISILWTFWAWIDWGNDFYVVTDKRAVWQERIVLMYESRHEAPLDAVLSVNLRSDFIQRLWGSGNIIINTYTGNIVMENIDLPDQLVDVIEEYWHRAQDQASQIEEETRVRMVRESIGMEMEEQADNQRQRVSKTSKSGGLQKFLNFLKTRYEEDGIVTYRKHWFLLLRRSWKAIAFLVAATVGAIWVYIHPNSYTIIIIGIVLLSNFVATIILIYHFIDWGNDIYQLTPRHIFDIDRKPFGQDSRKSAPLERILNTSVDQGFWQRFLNFGTVVINVGEAKFTFDGVVSPSLVQGEIFQRYYARKQQIEFQEAESERVRMVEWIKIYHEQVEGGRTVDHEPDIF
jgi:hypothetical protein